MTDIRVPTLGESVTEATIGRWFKQQGEAVAVDEPLVELETDKVTVEVPAPSAGVLSDIKVPSGTTVAIGAILGSISEGAGASPAKAATRPAGDGATARAKPALEPAPPPRAPAPAPAPAPVARAAPQPASRERSEMPPPPAARKLMEEKGLAPGDVSGSGRRGQVLKTDVMEAPARGGAPAISVDT